MTETKWTPAPWIVGKDDPEVSYSSEKNLPLGWVQITGRYPPYAFGRCVAHVAETQDANLIAAAPDLYAALAAMVEIGGEDDGRDVFAMARSALAKARGDDMSKGRAKLSLLSL